jgi:predicted Zn-dependent protease
MICQSEERQPPRGHRRPIAAGRGGRLRAGKLLRAVASVVVLAIAAGLGVAQRERIRAWQLSALTLPRLEAEARAKPDDVVLQEQLGRRLIEKGRPADALAAAGAAVRARAGDPRTWMLYGQAALGAGRPEEAARAWERALELDPGIAEAHFALGNYYRERLSGQGAIHQFHEYTRMRPDDPRGWLLLAQSFLDLNEPGNGLAAARRGLLERRDDPALLAAAGEGARQSGDLPAAGEFFRRALARQPENQAALIGLARVYLSQPGPPGQADEAIALLQRATRAAPADGQAGYELGQALARAGRLPAAVAEWERVLSAAGSPPPAAPNPAAPAPASARSPQTPGPDFWSTRCHHALALALARLGRPREAEAHRAIFQRLEARP